MGITPSKEYCKTLMTSAFPSSVVENTWLKSVFLELDASIELNTPPSILILLILKCIYYYEITRENNYKNCFWNFVIYSWYFRLTANLFTTNGNIFVN